MIVISNEELKDMQSNNPEKNAVRNSLIKAISVIVPLIITGVLVSGCSNNGKGVNMAAKEFDLNGFNKIDIGGAFEFEITQADTFKVSVLSDDFLHIRVEKQNDTLVIRRQGIEWFAPFHSQPGIRVALPALTEVNISGASHGKIENFQSDNDLTIKLSGASHAESRNISAGKLSVKVTGASGLTGDVKAARDARFESSGASRIELSGTGTNAAIDVSGASKAELGKFPIQNADLEISGASNVTISVNGKLDANISGASNLVWSGTPIMGDIQTSGASSLRRK
jgi:hypothetical protein